VSRADPFDFVRGWFAAFNRADLGGLEGFYAADARLETDSGVVEGRRAVMAAWSGRFGRANAGFDGGIRRRVRTVGRVENGVIHAEWQERELDISSGTMSERAGYSEFVIGDGQVTTQREVAYAVAAAAAEAPVEPSPPPSPRRYPPRPVVGVGAVIMHEGLVVLVKRKYEPLMGQWSLPGGTLDLGETLEAGVAREMLEETSLAVRVGPVIEVFDRILLDLEGRVRYHFVLIDYLCRPLGGRLEAGSDVDDAVYADPAALARYRLTGKAEAVIARAVSMAASGLFE
jgi:8-oxo-dGTP diphosphatase